MDKETILKEREVVINQIQEHVPLFAPYLSLNTSIKDYSLNIYNFKTNAIHLERQNLVITKITEKLQELFGHNALSELNVKLKAPLAHNIVDHHQVLNHALLIGSNVVANVNKIINSEKAPAIIVLSSGDVPPNNYFSKSGFQFHNTTIPLFSVSERETSTYYLPKRNFNFIERLKITKRNTLLSKDELEFLVSFQKKFDSFELEKYKDYKDQISVIVRNTWPLLFEEKLRLNLPELIYITQEELTANILKVLLNDKDNFIYQAMFNQSLRNIVLNNFRGIVVAWREDVKKGTHFFWRKHPNKPLGIRMYVEGDFLVPADAEFKYLRVHLDSATILELLEKKEIYPSLFLIFGVLNFFSGIKPLTGYGSTVYLEFLRNAWIKTLKGSQYDSEVILLENLDLRGFVGGVPIFFDRKNRKLRTLYAADIFFKGGVTEEYLHTVFKMKFSDLVSVAVADLYDYFSQKYIPEKERIKPKINFDDLAEISFNWI